MDEQKIVTIATLGVKPCPDFKITEDRILELAYESAVRNFKNAALLFTFPNDNTDESKKLQLETAQNEFEAIRERLQRSEIEP